MKGKTKALKENLVPVQPSSLQYPYGLAWEWTQASTVRGWWLKSWAMTESTFSYTIRTHLQTTCISLLHHTSHKNCNIHVLFNRDIIKYIRCAHSGDHQALFPHTDRRENQMIGGGTEKPPLCITSLQCMDFYFHVCYTGGGGPNISGIRIFRGNEM